MSNSNIKQSAWAFSYQIFAMHAYADIAKPSFMRHKECICLLLFW